MACSIPPASPRRPVPVPSTILVRNTGAAIYYVYHDMKLIGTVREGSQRCFILFTGDAVSRIQVLAVDAGTALRFESQWFVTTDSPGWQLDLRQLEVLKMRPLLPIRPASSCR